MVELDQSVERRPDLPKGFLDLRVILDCIQLWLGNERAQVVAEFDGVGEVVAAELQFEPAVVSRLIHDA